MATLALLDAATWPVLLAMLSPREAVRILLQWREQCAVPALSGQARAAIYQWAQSLPTLPGNIPAPLLALRLVGYWASALPLASPAPIGLACWLATLLPSLDMAGEASLAAQQSEFGSDWLELLAATSMKERKAAASLLKALRPSASTETTMPAAVLDARSAGLAWLLPALLELLDGEVAAALPPAACNPTCIAAFLTLAIASGPAGAQVWHDTFWRAFFRIPASWDAHAWLADADPVKVNQALTGALRRQSMGAPVMLRNAVVDHGSGGRLHAGPVPDELTGTPVPFSERLSLARLLRRDARFLGASPIRETLPEPWVDIFDTIAQATLRRVAHRIPGAARCSLPYLFGNVLGVGGHAREEDGAWLLELAKPPLHVLLSLNGMARLTLAWPGAGKLVLHCVDRDHA
jgi:hypothetical protein